MITDKIISIMVLVVLFFSIAGSFPNAFSLQWTNGLMRIDYPSTWKQNSTPASFSPLSEAGKTDAVNAWFRIDDGDFAKTVKSDISSLKFRHPGVQFNVIKNDPGLYAVTYSYVDKLSGINIWQFRKYQYLSDNKVGVESYQSPLSIHNEYWNDFVSFHIAYRSNLQASSFQPICGLHLHMVYDNDPNDPSYKWKWIYTC